MGTAKLSDLDWVDIDQRHIWHPYSAINASTPVYPVVSAHGVRLRLQDGRELIDGMASWWSAIHGYNHPVLNAAIQTQSQQMAHVMFGGLTHQPAAQLAQHLIDLTPEPLQSVFFADSGSVSIEAAMKMAIQYWIAQGHQHKHRFLTVRNGYHGDTLHAMSVCDPINGMHNLFTSVLPQQYFIEAPQPAFHETCQPEHLLPLQQTLAQHADNIAALMLEPIVQGTGGMRFYSPGYLQAARDLCDAYDVLLIADEIATGFGRSGKLFACEHADISPDILCLGKALTGGYMTLAAVLTTPRISQTISQGEPGVFMHGPTFMANPLACAVANASIELLLASPWRDQIAHIEASLHQRLMPCLHFEQVADVRTLGAIGVIELHQPVNMATIQPQFVERGAWVRPFGKLIYLMPPFIMNDHDLATLCDAVVEVVQHLPLDNAG